MTIEDVKQFSLLNTSDVDVVVLKEEGDDGDGYKLYLCGYIKQLRGIIVQSDGWSEEDLIRKLNSSYGMFREYFSEKEKINLPEKLNYNLNYVSPKEWIGK